ncbi:hypothetical protein N657DRAFT_673782 [Parathielavia appendiculata]|uniref:Uncharacterized protein n=1 Tax=Parathielavia appendiculata TaxID=2587402 RepID=A0AAN6TV13_9PEZI|nr:hypothetical protein N657DRAFT_673782 [Parathielavia appendiculata]
MALFQDLGSWLRSVRRDGFTDSPVSAIQKLKSVPRPLRDADKEGLVGAVLTMSSSLHVALSILRELLPQEQSRERLGEVLCPTLGHLRDSVQSTLSAFEQPISAPSTRTDVAPRVNPPQPHSSSTQLLAPQPMTTANLQAPRLTTRSPDGGQQQQTETRTERFPHLGDHSSDARRLHVEADINSGPQTQLVQALQAEMRVQAAIHVAIESLEFAETQLKVVKEVNQLHGGSVDLLQQNFYEGYNRLLLRALELQRRELGLSTGENLSSNAPTRGQLPYRQQEDVQASPKQHQSVWFQNISLAIHSAARIPRSNGMDHAAASERRPLGRRNTIQGIRQEGSRDSAARPPFKRRLSLADELAMVGEDSESGYQDETSDGANSASELEESYLESRNRSHRVTSREVDTKDYSTNGDDSGEESADDSSDHEDSGDETLDAMKSLNGSRAATTGVNRSRSRLPRLQQPCR